MAMEKTGVTEQDIADALTGKSEVKEAHQRPRPPVSPIGDDPLSKLASHAKKAIQTQPKTGQ